MKRSPIARDLRTPKYRQRVERNRKRDLRVKHKTRESGFFYA